MAEQRGQKTDNPILQSRTENRAGKQKADNPMLQSRTDRTEGGAEKIENRQPSTAKQNRKQSRENRKQTALYYKAEQTEQRAEQIEQTDIYYKQNIQN